MVGTGDALDLSLSGRTVDAETALRVGLVQRVTEDPLSVAEEIAGNDPASLRVLKELVPADGDREAREAREREAFVERLRRGRTTSSTGSPSVTGWDAEPRGARQEQSSRYAVERG